MKIRNRITAWITGAGLLAALLFSLVISIELIEQPFKIVDKVLAQQSALVLSELFPLDEQAGHLPNKVSKLFPEETDWLRIYDSHQNVVFTSERTQLVDIPLRLNDRHYIYRATVNAAEKHDQARDSRVFFRVFVETVSHNGEAYTIQLAKPMEKLWEEIVELIVIIGIGLVVFTLALITFGYMVAGKILEPIATINRLAREINDKTLQKRIPLGTSEDELYVLSTSLNQMFDRLHSSFHHQKEFIANASHELKTPITMLRLFFDEALQNGDLSEKLRETMAVQSAVVFRMNRLVKNLLDLSTLELNNTLDLEMIDLSRLTASTFEEFSEIIRAAGIRLSLNAGDHILQLADKEKIRRVLINLIDNAIKYNLARNGEIQCCLSQDNNVTVMNIANTGQTIPADELEAVFDQFYRVEKSRSTKLGGSGLGLTIVRQIVELHQGSISISTESVPADRIMVEVRLPRVMS